MMWSVASESEQAVSNKKDFSQPTLSLNLFWFHWFHRDVPRAANTLPPRAIHVHTVPHFILIPL